MFSHVVHRALESVLLRPPLFGTVGLQAPLQIRSRRSPGGAIVIAAETVLVLVLGSRHQEMLHFQNFEVTTVATLPYRLEHGGARNSVAYAQDAVICRVHLPLSVLCSWTGLDFVHSSGSWGRALDSTCLLRCGLERTLGSQVGAEVFLATALAGIMACTLVSLIFAPLQKLHIRTRLESSNQIRPGLHTGLQRKPRTAWHVPRAVVGSGFRRPRDGKLAFGMSCAKSPRAMQAGESLSRRSPLLAVF